MARSQHSCLNVEFWFDVKSGNYSWVSGGDPLTEVIVEQILFLGIKKYLWGRT